MMFLMKFLKCTVTLGMKSIITAWGCGYVRLPMRQYAAFDCCLYTIRTKLESDKAW